MPEWLLVVLITVIFGIIVSIIGFFLKSTFKTWNDNQTKAIEKQDESIQAINNLNLTLQKLDAKIELYKAHADMLSQNVNELKADIDYLGDKHEAINIRLVNLEKEHSIYVNNKINPHDSCSGRQ